MTDGKALVEHALAYAQRGWPVFPCNPRDKRPLPPKDRDPATGAEIPNSGGLKKATTDADIIRAWWQKWPKAMIGCALGDQAQVFVLDVDAGEDKATGETFTAEGLVAELEAFLGCKLPATWWVETQRGGRHYYFQLPAPGFSNAKGALGETPSQRFDVRGQGGYVILPPSRMATGKGYAWRDGPKLAGELPAKAPAALLDCIARLGKFARQAAAGDDVVDLAERAPARPSNRSSKAPAPKPAGELPGGERGERWAEESVQRYAQAALAAETKQLAGTREGGRQNQINISALKLGHLVGAGALTADEVRRALGQVVAQWRDVKKSLDTIERAMAKGMETPADLAPVRSAAHARAAQSSSSAFASPPPPASAEDYGATLPPGESGQAGKGAAPPAAKTRRPSATQEGGGGQHGSPPDDSQRQRGLDQACAFLPMTDLGNAERFVKRFRNRLMFSPAMGWLWWDARHWASELAKSRVTAGEHITMRAIQEEAAWLAESGRDVVVEERKARRPAGWKRGDAEPEPDAVMMSDKLAQFGRASESKPRMRVADDAAAYLSVAPAQLDADPYKINVLNGTLHVLRRGGTAEIVLRPHDPADLITKLAPVVYDPEAQAPNYDAFLERVQPDPAMRTFIAQWGGYSLSGDAREQIFTFHWGKGKNGKSTLLNAWGHVAGDYGTSIRIETFLDQAKASSGSAATPDLAMLRRVRYLRTSEPEKGAKLAEALIKLATGGEPLNVRHLNCEFFQLLPEFKLTMSGNYKPGIVGTDEGIWRRVRLVPWTVEIPETERIKDFDRVKLYPEASGILNRLLAGLVDWIEHGLTMPKQVVAATEEYRTDSDPLGRFLTACTETGSILDTHCRVQSSVLHALFLAWCKANGEREWTATGFGRAMRERGMRSIHSDVNWWVGIKATKAPADFIDSQGMPWATSRSTPHGAAAPDDEVPL